MITKQNEVTVTIDENGNILELDGCKKAFFAFLEDEQVYRKVPWPKGSYTLLIDEVTGQITFKTDSRLRIVCGHFEAEAKAMAKETGVQITCPPGYKLVWVGGQWVCIPIG
ncbi:MAG: hypothetical protein P4L55_00090 [Syntrophobacteraceae bacterium]|nr:hypothetical protein [Syntrophobacteraceae bacterium]